MSTEDSIIWPRLATVVSGLVTKSKEEGPAKLVALLYLDLSSSTEKGPSGRRSSVTAAPKPPRSYHPFMPFFTQISFSRSEKDNLIWGLLLQILYLFELFSCCPISSYSAVHSHTSFTQDSVAFEISDGALTKLPHNLLCFV